MQVSAGGKTCGDILCNNYSTCIRTSSKKMTCIETGKIHFLNVVKRKLWYNMLTSFEYASFKLRRGYFHLSILYRKRGLKGNYIFFALFGLMLGTHGLEHWGFFSVPHLLWHWSSVNNGHLRGPVTLTLNAKRLAVELSLPVLTTRVRRSWISNTQHSTYGANALNNCPTAAAI